MSKPQLILHIGSHKTGTTAVQTYLSKNRQALRSGGIVYPALPAHLKTLRMTHHHVAAALSDDPARAWTEAGLAGWLRDLAVKAELGDTILLSSEMFWSGRIGPIASVPERHSARRRYVARVADALEAFDVTIAAVIRPQDDFLLSVYKGACARWSGHEQVPSIGDGWKVSLTDYVSILSAWEEAFEGRVRVALYEPGLRGAQGLQRRFDDFGLVHSVVDEVAENRHVSPGSLVMAEFLRAVGSVGAEKAVAGEVKDHAMRAFGDPDRGQALARLYDRRAFTVKYPSPPAEVNETVRERYFPQMDTPLFGREITDRFEEYVPNDPEALAALVAQVFREAGRAAEFAEATRLGALAQRIALLPQASGGTDRD